jgi:transposase
VKHFVGIDLATRSSQICVIDQDRKVQFNRKLPNHWSVIEMALSPYRESVSVVIEASCNWYWLADKLQDNGYDLKLAHPVKLKAITDAKIKTDRRDAHWLALLLAGGLIPEAHICPRHQRRLRDLCRWRWRLVNYGSVMTRQQQQILTNEGLWENTRQAIVAFEKNGLEDLPIHELAKIPLYNLSYARDALAACVDDLDHKIAEGITNMPEFKDRYERYREINGFGPVNAATVLLESGDMSRFKSDKGYISYCRLTPGIAQSGETVKRGRRRKAGNPHLKRAYSSAAMHAARGSERIRHFRDVHLVRRTGIGTKLIVNNIIAHKQATAVYHMTMKGQRWDIERLFPMR